MRLRWSQLLSAVRPPSRVRFVLLSIAAIAFVLLLRWYALPLLAGLLVGALFTRSPTPLKLGPLPDHAGGSALLLADLAIQALRGGDLHSFAAPVADVAVRCLGPVQVWILATQDADGPPELLASHAAVLPDPSCLQVLRQTMAASPHAVVDLAAVPGLASDPALQAAQLLGYQFPVHRLGIGILLIAADTPFDIGAQTTITVLGDLLQGLAARDWRTIQWERSVGTNRALIHAIPDLLLRVGADGVIRDFHAPPTALMLGAPAELPGTALSRWLDPPAAALLQQAIAGALTGSEGASTHELTLGAPPRIAEVRIGRCSPDEALLIVRDVTDRMRYEQMLRTVLREKDETVALLDAVLTTAPIGFAYVGEDLRLVRANASLAAMVLSTYNPQETSEPRALPAPLAAICRQVFESEEPVDRVSLNGTFPDAPETLRHWLASGYPVRLADSPIIGVGLVVVDVTEQTRLESALREHHALLQLSLQMAGAAAWSWDPDRNITRWSDEFYPLFGLDPARVRPSQASWLACVHPEDRLTLAQEAPRLLSAANGFRREYRIVRPDGSQRWISDRVRRMEGHDDQGPLIGFSIDITAHKQMEAALRAHEAHYQTLVEQFPDGAVVLIGTHGRCLAAGGQALPRLGLRANALVGAPLTAFGLPPALGAQLEQLCHVVLRGEAGRSESVAADRRYELQGVPVRDADGHVISGMIVLHDSTHRWAAAQDLRRARESAEVADRAKSVFLAAMNHKIRAPLNSMLSNTALLQSSWPGEPPVTAAMALSQIRTSAENLLTLVSNIHDLTAIESGEASLSLAPTDIATLCQNSWQHVQAAVASRKLHVETQFTAEITSLLVDPLRITQILSELLANAVKCTPSGGHVSLHVSADSVAQTVCFTVIDTGVGIAAGDLQRIFHPFVQIDGSFTHEEQSPGLGLTLAQRRALLHGGRIDVESSPGTGSSFRLTIPRRTQLAQRRFGTAPLPALATPPVAGPILVVDDDERGRSPVVHYLQSRGYQICEASDAETAFALLEREHPVAILMDVQMPNMDGLEAIRRIRQMLAYTRIPILCVTALAMQGDRQRCLAAGADCYLSKPVSLRDLAATLAQLLVSKDTLPSRD